MASIKNNLFQSLAKKLPLWAKVAGPVILIVLVYSLVKMIVPIIKLTLIALIIFAIVSGVMYFTKDTEDD